MIDFNGIESALLLIYIGTTLLKYINNPEGVALLDFFFV